ncbi:hypothetical protein CEXT_549111 [Caerostris extrusa]|uniref:Uncharacterized protein n=1 Tax=Caerostris extrusa TaxID=172846 RepID=A0AAV4N6Z1_CAEEX|nr:hypothetical protein CEXT_549111 [Caerostris extrusa]
MTFMVTLLLCDSNKSINAYFVLSNRHFLDLSDDTWLSAYSDKSNLGEQARDVAENTIKHVAVTKRCDDSSWRSKFLYAFCQICQQSWSFVRSPRYIFVEKLPFQRSCLHFKFELIGLTAFEVVHHRVNKQFC